MSANIGKIFRQALSSCNPIKQYADDIKTHLKVLFYWQVFFSYFTVEMHAGANCYSISEHRSTHLLVYNTLKTPRAMNETYKHVCLSASSVLQNMGFFSCPKVCINFS